MMAGTTAGERASATRVRSPRARERSSGAGGRRPHGHGRRSDADAWLGPLGTGVIVVSLGFLLAGVVWPQAAEALLRLLLTTLAGGFVAARAYYALEAANTPRDRSSPFGGDAAARTPPVAPPALRRLTSELGDADDARLAERAPIPRSVRWAVMVEASRRLAEHHGLSLDDPDHHPRIRALVSEPTWSFVGPRDRRPLSAARAKARGRPVPLSRLGLILDDVESL